MRTVRININNFKPGDKFVAKQDEGTWLVQRPLRNMCSEARSKHRKELRLQRVTTIDTIMAQLNSMGF